MSRAVGRGAKRTRGARAGGGGHSSEADDSCVLPPELKEPLQAAASVPFPAVCASPPPLPGDSVRSSSSAARARCPSAAAADAAPDARSQAFFSGSSSRLASRCTRRERSANRNGDTAAASNSSANAGVRTHSARPGTAADTTAATACGTCSITSAPVNRPTRAARDSSLYLNNEAFEMRQRIDVILDPLVDGCGVRGCTASSGAANDGAELTAGRPFLRSSFDFPSFRELRRLATEGHRSGRSGGSRKGPNFRSFSPGAPLSGASGTSILKVSPSASSTSSGKFAGGSCS